MRDFLRRRVLPNLGLKLVSLALATGLWLAVARDPVAEVAVNVPIEFRDIPENLEIDSENIPQAQIRLRGAEHAVRGLQAADVRAEVALDGVKPGERTFDLTAQQVRRPGGIEVVQIVPSQVHLSFDVRAMRQVEVRPRVMGSFVSGYSIARIVVEPSIITISGPRKRVEAVEGAITDPVDVSGTMDRITFMRHAYLPDPLIQVTNPNPVRVTVIMEKTPGGGR
jgi:YbbR domain-containing protein